MIFLGKDGEDLSNELAESFSDFNIRNIETKVLILFSAFSFKLIYLSKSYTVLILFVR